ncbi:hypothetical protein B0H63DRAFT_548862 [Podospora didyma]|uniref:Uncharacterized protein n=1 Tax=Podospora didyma TaxID=330526 RepID=A0AAE0KDA8_9PEZI|nr:hypothetical protein B0H63DRAFT_548862 [Podospora didyma]
MTNHGTQNLLCLPPKLSDYVLFFAANYVSHAATLVSVPGETSTETIVAALSALFVPGYGILRALPRLFLHAGLTHNSELRRAARAVSSLKRALHGSMARSNLSSSLDNIQLDDESFVLIQLPPDTPLRSFRSQIDTTAPEPTLSYTYNIPKIIIGLLKAVWGTVTLYKSRGSQIDLYGYAALGLSVAPYVFMSLVNIAIALVTPEYPALYYQQS